MTDKQRELICTIAGISEIGELSNGYNTFNSLYRQRMVLFAALVKVYKDKAWKSRAFEDGSIVGWNREFIVGIDTPQGTYARIFKSEYWKLFECVELDKAKHWDGHTDDDVEKLLSL